MADKELVPLLWFPEEAVLRSVDVVVVTIACSVMIWRVVSGFAYAGLDDDLVGGPVGRTEGRGHIQKVSPLSEPQE